MITKGSKGMILISSCARDRANGAQDAARDTWIANWRKYMKAQALDYRFVLGDGNGNIPAADELIVDAPDDYSRLWYKNQQGWKYFLTPDWMYRTPVEFVFQCCVDTYVMVPEIRRIADVIGDHYMGVPCLDGHVGGGLGYFLDGWAASQLMAYDGPVWSYEDQTTHHVLAKKGIHLYGLPHNSFSVHLSKDTGVYDPEWMRQFHRKYVRDIGCLT